MSPVIQLVAMNIDFCGHTELERSLLSRLHETERLRYASFMSPQRRRAWLAGRALLCATLERQLGQVDAASIRTDAQGGVQFLDEALHLSISHSRNMLVVSLSSVRVGVDIERLQARALLQYTERVFNRAEATQLHRQTGARRLDAFYALWTLKEAACKAAGMPLLESLHSARFDLSDGSFHSHPPFPSGGWHFMCARIEPGWRVAVATQGATCAPRIECWQMNAGQWRRQALARQVFLSGN